MRRILYIIVLASLFAVPAQRSDVGNMLPVELVLVYTQGDRVEVRTDTGNSGAGKDLQEAALDLKKSASKELFLDTADYLMLSGDRKLSSEELRSLFKPDIYVCEADPEINLEEAAGYLSEHPPKHRLKEIDLDSEISVIRKTENGFSLS